MGEPDRKLLCTGGKEEADMNKLIYGSKTYGQDDIFSGKVHIATSLRSSSLEVNTLSAEVRDTDGTLKNFSRKAPITWLYDEKQKGIFYLQEAERIGRNSSLSRLLAKR